jgi:Anti-sigma factor NepR
MRVKVRGHFQASMAEDGASSKPRFPRPIRVRMPDEPKLDPGLQAHIGAQLRSYYAELIDEPVPSRFVELLKRLDRKH